MTGKRVLFIVLTAVILIASLSWYAQPAAAAGAYPTDFDSMLARAEAIINYKWTPPVDIATWNNSTYNGAKVFRKGSTVTGMPYSLFVYELGFDSLLSLAQYKKIVNSNYSTTKYCVSVSADRTGPAYGSCCATFVSEVFGGDFMNGDNPRYDSVLKIKESPYSYTFTGTVDKIKPGDALSTSNNGHIIWVGGVSSTSLTIYEQTPPVARKRTVSKTSVDGSGYLIYNGSTYKTVSRPAGNGGNTDCECSTAYAGTYVCTTNSGDLNIRAGHGSSYGIVGVIPHGAEVTVTKASGSGTGDWAHVSYNGITGCASMKYLTKKNDAPADCGCSDSYAGTYVCTTSSEDLNIRAGHGSSYPIVGTIPRGAVVTVTKASGEGSGNWAHVTYNGVSGFASMGYLKKQSGAVCEHRFTAAAEKPEALKSAGNCRDGAVYYYSCSVCGAVEKNDSNTFTGGKNPSVHVGGTKVVNAKEADHKNQTDGYTGDTECLGCGAILSRGTVIPSGAHVSSGENAATCCKKAVCDLCGEEYGDLLPHEYGTGYSSDASGHWHACTTGGCTEKSGFEAHTPDRAGDDGSAVRCGVCGFVIREGHEHDLKKTDAVPPSCEKSGTEACWTCAGCGKLFADEAGTEEIGAPVTVPALGHDFGEWKVTKEATADETGLSERVCSRCSEKETGILPKKEAPVTEETTLPGDTSAPEGTGESGAKKEDESRLPGWVLPSAIGAAVLAAIAITAAVLTGKKKAKKR
ncbi:MAG: SH3 domain-containing protein [Lachnospiraceae bacterium]|nr:SH3 domain-containing protein [Lachnospiraceae bacterium]